MKLAGIAYSQLNARQKENFNFQIRETLEPYRIVGDARPLSKGAVAEPTP